MTKLKELKEYDNKSINSPFRWAGGKFYARKIIEAYIPKHDYYIEPFLGGGSVFFHKNKVDSWLNDFDRNLVNCYKNIKNNVVELIEYLDGEVATKERHAFYKNEFQPTNSLEKAARYYYLNRTSYSGIMKEVNCYWGYGDKYSMRPENWGRQLSKNHKKLQDTKLTSVDFEDIFDNLPTNKNIFIFLDPPYYNADQNKFYEKSFTLHDHERLSQRLKKLSKKVKFLLTYDNSVEVRELYSWANQVNEHEWNYVIARTDDQKLNKKLEDGHSAPRGKGKEIFIFNYDLEELTKQKELDFLTSK
jgi:DNA adenine methylase